jgi:hypothetical protein
LLEEATGVDTSLQVEGSSIKVIPHNNTAEVGGIQGGILTHPPFSRSEGVGETLEVHPSPGEISNEAEGVEVILEAHPNLEGILEAHPNLEAEIREGTIEGTKVSKMSASAVAIQATVTNCARTTPNLSTPLAFFANPVFTSRVHALTKINLFE